MKNISLSIFSLLLSVAAPGQTYSDANLTGNYSVQLISPQTYKWARAFTCPTNSTVHTTVNGSQVGTNVVYGVATFDGAGKLTVSFNSTSKENNSASAATTSVTCNSSCQVVSVNAGHVVYLAPVTGTSTGTYSVASGGTGTMTLAAASQPFTLLLAATSGGISNNVLIASTAVNGKPIVTGTAVHE